MISYCPKCGKPVADDVAFCPNCGASLRATTAPPPTQPSYSKPADDHGPKPDNNLVLAIITAVLCCVPLGIWAIVLASKVDGLWNSGHYAEARENAEKAKTISIVGLILGVIYVVVVVGISIASEM